MEVITDAAVTNDLLVDALLHGRKGFLQMTDDELLDACDTWDVMPVMLS